MQLTGPIAHHVREVGEALEIGANQPFWLSESDSFWMVEQGTVDIFSVRKEKGRPDGRRRRLCRIRAGEFIFPLNPGNSDHSLSFLGVPGPDTCLIRTNIAHLESMQKDPVLAEALAEAADTWVLVLSASLSVGRLVPKYSQEIKEGQTLDLEPGLTVRCGARSLWIVQGDGAALGNGALGFSLEQLDAKDTDSHHNHAEMDDVAAITTMVAASQMPQGERQALTMRAMPGPGAAPKFIQGHRNDKGAQPDANQGGPKPNTGDIG